MLLPIYTRRHIIAFAAVDVEDYADVSKHRWFADRYGYVRRQVPTTKGYRAVLLHRAIAEPPAGREVDHIDRNPRNNRRSNLRIASHAENHQNKGSNRNALSRFRGVTFDRRRGKWVAKHKLHGRTHNLGRFSTEQEAAIVAAEFRAKHMPFSTEGRLGV